MTVFLCTSYAYGLIKKEPQVLQAGEIFVTRESLNARTGTNIVDMARVINPDEVSLSRRSVSIGVSRENYLDYPARGNIRDTFSKAEIRGTAVATNPLLSAIGVKRQLDWQPTVEAALPPHAKR